jgi:hypothetical protein
MYTTEPAARSIGADLYHSVARTDIVGVSELTSEEFPDVLPDRAQAKIPSGAAAIEVELFRHDIAPIAATLAAIMAGTA